jgi:hypothetical protein
MERHHDISPRQATAYARVMAVLRSGDGFELDESESDAIRQACDALVLGDGDARERLERARHVCAVLEASGRLEHERVERLRSDLESCGARSAVAA